MQAAGQSVEMGGGEREKRDRRTTMDTHSYDWKTITRVRSRARTIPSRRSRAADEAKGGE